MSAFPYLDPYEDETNERKNLLIICLCTIPSAIASLALVARMILKKEEYKGPQYYYLIAPLFLNIFFCTIQSCGVILYHYFHSGAGDDTIYTYNGIKWFATNAGLIVNVIAITFINIKVLKIFAT